MKSLLTVGLLILLLFSCRTKEERARRLVERANKLYPIIEMIDTVIVVDTLIKWDTTIVVKVDSVPFSVVVEKPVNGKFTPYRDKEIYRSDKAVVKASMTEEGVMSFLVDIKPIYRYIEGEIRYIDTNAIKTKLIRTPAEKIQIRGFFWWLGATLSIGIIGFALYKGYRYYRSKFPI